MKKTHLFLLLLTAVLALTSAYSLTAINQVYSIDFEWYSQMDGRYENLHRDVSRDKCLLPLNKLDICLMVIDGSDSLNVVRKQYSTGLKYITDMDLMDNVFIYCMIGKTVSPEYRIKVVDIAQRGNNMEIKVSINTPGSIKEDFETGVDLYKPEDVVKIKKSAFPSTGKLFVIFKNQDGRELAKQYCYV